LNTLARRIIKGIDDYLNVLKEIQDKVMEPTATEFNLHVTLDQALGSKRLSSNIDVSRNYHARNPKIWALQRQLRQVFLVVLQNAITALNGEGRLTLETKDVQVDGASFFEVSIADTGPGIPKHVQDDLFKIKPIILGRRGMKLGLPWAYSFLRTYGGALDYETSNLGTTFIIRIPVDWRETRKILDTGEIA
jgi:nitrogen-specific signal transduction histidine kinase